MPLRALQAIVFDFDGVIADSEHLHLRAYQQVLAPEGISISNEEYFERYLGYDDVGVFTALLKDKGVPLDDGRMKELIERKGQRYESLAAAGDMLFPGAADFIRTAAAAVPIAIASGALRHEIDEILEPAGLAGLFETIVASGDTPQSKPSPAPYLLAFERLRKSTGRDLEGRRCVAIEDSRWGLESARGAGLRCVGVTNSYPADQLGNVELVVSGLDELTLPNLEALCSSD